MEINELKNSIKLEFDPRGMPGLGEINEAINETIRSLNRDHNLQRVFITITGTVDEEHKWSDIETKWGEVTEKWKELGGFIEGFGYDATNYILTVPDNIKQIEDLYRNDVKQVPSSYTKTFNTYSEYEDWVYLTYGTHYNVPANAYTCIGNKIYFNDDVSADVVKIICYKEYDEIKDDKLIVPEFFRQYLISNPIVILGSRPKNIISDRAYSRHILEAEKSLGGLNKRILEREHTAGLDCW